MYYRTMYLQAIAEGHQFGEWLHLGISTPQDTDIVTPNNDTPYSYAWLDLRAEPWVLTLPQVEADRYITSQWNDMWGYVLDNPGSVLDGNNGVNVMFVSPDWQGDVPAGIKRIIRGETHFVGSLVNRLFGQAGDDLGIGPLGVTDDTNRRYEREFKRPLIENHNELPMTVGTPPPLIYELQYGSDNQFRS